MTDPKKGYLSGVDRLVLGNVSSGKFTPADEPAEGFIPGVLKVTSVSIDDNGDTDTETDNAGIRKTVTGTVTNGVYSSNSQPQEGLNSGVYRATEDTEAPEEGFISGLAGIVIGSVTDGEWSGSLSIVEGWAGEEDCVADVTKVTVSFNKTATYTHGIVGITVTSDGGQVFTITSIAGTGTQIVTYTGSWDTAIEAGDVITWAYDGTGDYNDATVSTTYPELHFNSDTQIIALPDTAMFNAAGHLQWEQELDNTTQASQDVWGNQGDTTYVFRCKNTTVIQSNIANIFADNITNWVVGERDIWKFTWDGGTAGELFKNGVTVNTFLVGTGTTADDFAIGAAPDGVIGTIKDVRLYNASGVLTDHWPIDDDSGTTIRNVTTPARVGALTIGTGAWSSPTSGKLMSSQSKIITNCLNLVTPIILSAAMISGDQMRVTYDQAVDQNNLDTIEVSVNSETRTVISPLTVSNQTVVDYTLIYGVLPDDTITFDGTGTNLVEPFSDTFNVSNGPLNGHTPTAAGDDWVADSDFTIASSIVEKANANFTQADITQFLSDFTLTYDGQSIQDPAVTAAQDNNVRIRVVDTSNHVRCIMRTTSGGDFYIRLEERIAGAQNQADDLQLVGIDFSAALINMTVVASGTTVTMYPTSDDTQNISLTGLAETDATNIALLGAGNSPGDNARWDNVVVHI